MTRSVLLFQVVALAVAVLAVYSGGLQNAFQYDDIHSLVENPHVRSVDSIPQFFLRSDLFSVDPKSGMYRPLVLVSYALNHAIGGYQVFGYHLVNIALHITVSGALCLLIGYWTESALRGLVTGLLFALHPINSETVNYVSSRSESLCALFLILALFAYLRAASGNGMVWRGLSLLAFAASLLSKSVGIALPAVLLLVDFVTARGRALDRRPLVLLRRHLPYWLIAVAYMVIVGAALDTALVSEPLRSATIQACTQVKAVAYYLKLLALPHPLNVEHQFFLASGGPEAPVVFAGLFGISLVAVTAAVGRKLPGGLFWMLAALLFLLPTLVIPLNVLVNEHRLYLPSAVLALGLGGALACFSRRRFGTAALAGVALLLTFGLHASNRTVVWSSHESLWTAALQWAPSMPRPNLYVGDHHREIGEYEKALAAYQRALTVYPEVLSGGDLLAIHNNRGSTLLAMGRNGEAIAAYRQALEVDSTFARSREALDALLALQQKERDPRANALYKQGLQLIWRGNLEVAVQRLRQSLAAQALPEAYQTLALAYRRMGKMALELRAYEDLIALDPDSPRAETARREIEALSATGERR